MECVSCPVRQYTIYRSVPESELEKLFEARLGVSTLDRGQLIMEDQRETPYVYTLRSGWAYSFALLSDGRRQILSFFHPGDFLTTSALLGEGLRASVRCLTEVELCKFDKKKLRAFFRKSEVADNGLFEYLGAEKRLCDERMIELGALSAEEAVASLITEFVLAAKKRGCEASEIPFPLRLAEIAETVGITEIHAGRIIRGLERRGAIQRTKAGGIKADEAALQSILTAAGRLFLPA